MLRGNKLYGMPTLCATQSLVGGGESFSESVQIILYRASTGFHPLFLSVLPPPSPAGAGGTFSFLLAAATGFLPTAAVFALALAGPFFTAGLPLAAGL